jgi:N12 class adenine-specific DNA methylase
MRSIQRLLDRNGFARKRMHFAETQFAQFAHVARSERLRQPRRARRTAEFSRFADQAARGT